MRSTLKSEEKRIENDQKQIQAIEKKNATQFTICTLFIQMSAH